MNLNNFEEFNLSCKINKYSIIFNLRRIFLNDNKVKDWVDETRLAFVSEEFLLKNSILLLERRNTEL
jgi:hypothetical protein